MLPLGPQAALGDLDEHVRSSPDFRHRAAVRELTRRAEQLPKWSTATRGTDQVGRPKHARID
jgi:hypothetical protein